MDTRRGSNQRPHAWDEHAAALQEGRLFEEYQAVERAAIRGNNHGSRMRPSSRCAARSRSTSSSMFYPGKQ